MEEPTASSSSSPSRCNEEHLAEPTSSQTLLRDLHGTTAMEESSITTAEVSLPSGHCLSSSPIWMERDFDWGITFCTIKDVSGYFHTFPRVGGPFQSKDEAEEAIDRYLTDHTDLTMGIGLSEVDRLIQDSRYYPDGTKRRLKGQPIDKMRDGNYQLAQAVVHKYNDHHNLFGDLAFEAIDTLDGPSLWEGKNDMTYWHMNFTAKTKGSDSFDTCNDNLFFVELIHVSGDGEFTVNCCCMVEPSDNGPCFGCRSTMKHPNDSNAYIAGRVPGSYGLPFGDLPSHNPLPDEDSDEEVERLRFLFGGAPATDVPLDD